MKTVKNKMAQQGWHPEDIRAAVRKTGVSLRGLALLHGYNPSLCTKALHTPQPTGNHIIAQHIGVPIHHLWPQWYDEKGDRVYHQWRRKYTRRTPSATLKKMMRM